MSKIGDTQVEFKRVSQNYHFVPIWIALKRAFQTFSGIFNVDNDTYSLLCYE